MKITVFLIDDHGVLRQGLRMLIESQADMEVVGEYDRGRGVVPVLQKADADVVVIDISMPDLSGSRTTEEIRAALPRTKILALTRHAEKAYVQQMLAAGATGYVLKQTKADILLAAIRAVAGGGTFFDPAIADKVSVHRTAVRADAAEGAASLTEREQEVVTMVTYGHTNKEIAATLSIAVKTVETHKTNIMQKLGITSRAELVRFALAQGWLEQ